MKDLIKLLLKLSLIVLVVYSLVFTLYSLKEHEFGLVRDAESGNVITGFKDRYNFVWQGALPWKFNVEKVGLKYSSIMDVSIQIPALSSLSDDLYYIRIPMNISYRISKDNLPEISYLTGEKNIDQYIATVAAGICSSMLIDNIDPKYNRDGLVREQKRLNDEISAEISKKLESLGIITEKLEFILPGYYPENRLYEEALVRNREMRELTFQNSKEDIMLKKQLQKDKGEFEVYYEKLNKISKLIKENPQILKYIYIDKMGDNIKVIISSDKTGIPAIFGDSADANDSGVKGDIDNLR